MASITQAIRLDHLATDISGCAFAFGSMDDIEKSYGFVSLKGTDLAAALQQTTPAPPPSAPSPSSSSSATPQLPSFGPSTTTPTATARNPKHWRAYTHLHTASEALACRALEDPNNEDEGWEDEEWWFERDGMEDFVCLGRVKAKGKGGGAGGARRTSTAGSAGAPGAGQGQGAGGSGSQLAQVQAPVQAGTQGGMQGLLLSFTVPQQQNGGGGA